MAGRIKRLLVLMPPQHGKSELVTRRLSAKWLGNDPEKRLLVCSHSSDLATSMNRDVQQIIDSLAYQGLFRGTKLARSACRVGLGSGSRPAGVTCVRRTLDYFEVVGHRGSLRTVGVGQRIAGNPCDVGIVDDPFGSREDAESPVVRNRIWSWYTGDFYPRLSAGAPVLVTHTPWHRDDVQGRLLRQMLDKTADQWTVLAFPAIKVEPALHPNPHDTRKPGEPLWPEFKSLEELRKIEAQDRRMFAALYQLNPAEVGGTEWAPEYFGQDIWCQEADGGPECLSSWPPQFEVSGIGVDPSKGAKDRQGDYCAIVFLGRRNGMFYVDANLEPRNSRDVVRAVRQFADSHRPDAIGFESDQFQELLSQQMQADAPDMLQRWKILEMPTGGKPKQVRIRKLSPYITDRRLRFRVTPGCRLLVDQLMDFPAADHDDGPDALEQAFRVLYYLLGITA
jgi:predicted phage terminase large subunit-like protein